MHLAFLTPEYPHAKTEPAAGIGTSIKNMVIALVKKNIKISIFVYNQSCLKNYYPRANKMFYFLF